MSTGNVFVFYSDKINYKAVDDGIQKKYFIEGYISTGDLDLVNDIVTKSCMDDMTGQFDDRTIKLDFEHEAFRGKDSTESMINKTRIPLGKAVNKLRDAKGVKVKWEMNPTWKKFDENGNTVMTFKDIWSNVENGYYDAFSIAYVPTKTASQKREGKDIRLLDKVNLLNVALTGNPINQEATMTSVMAKSLKYMKEVETMQKKGYEKDGNHVHEEGNAMGVHNHGEIEKEIERLWDGIFDMKQKLSQVLSDVKEEANGLKSTKTKGDKMVDKKDEDPKPAEGDGQAPAAEGKLGEGAAPEGEQKSSKDMLEVKSALADIKGKLDKLEDDLKAKDGEIKELKGIVEKARHKATGAANKSEMPNNQAVDVKSVGPLDYV